MSISAEKKQELIQEHKINAQDTGSAEVQCAILTERIKNLTEHFKVNKHDYHSRRGLLILVSRRRRLLRYIERKDTQKYKDLITKLGLRK